MKASNLTFEAKDVVKLVGFVAVVCGMWYDLKSDLRVFKATTELRIMRLEKEQDRSKEYPQSYAMIPNEPKITNDD